VTIADAGAFTPAEDYHQNFHNTNTAHYKRYRAGCGHDRRLKELWGSQADAAAH
jgi:peptide-methionine (S)-S-oxide reductase